MENVELLGVFYQKDVCKDVLQQCGSLSMTVDGGNPYSSYKPKYLIPIDDVFMICICEGIPVVAHAVVEL